MRWWVHETLRYKGNGNEWRGMANMLVSMTSFLAVATLLLLLRQLALRRRTRPLLYVQQFGRSGTQVSKVVLA